MDKSYALKRIAILITILVLVCQQGQVARADGTDPFHLQNNPSGSTTRSALGPESVLPSQTITIPGAQITALQEYETGNKLFLADDNTQSVKVINGADNQIITTIPNVGGAVFDMAVNETHGKVYAASDKACCTTGITPGNGLISIINANTNKIITQINPGPQGNASYFILGSDEVHDKIYVAFFSGVGVIDASTNKYTLIPNAGAPYPYLSQIGINTVTNRIFLPTFNSGLTIINGNDLSVQTIGYPAGSGKAVDVAVNQIENKVYITMITIPGQGEMGIFILDLDTQQHLFVGAEDLEPLSFNNTNNVLFTGVQIGAQASIVDGQTNQLAYIDLGTNGISDIAARLTTNRAYLINREYTVVVDGSSKTLYDRILSNPSSGGGLLISNVEINQKTGKVYVVNDGDTGTVTIFQDPTFFDVPPAYWSWTYIERVFAAGITGGCSTSPMKYCPSNSVSRAQMAVFLLRAKHGSSYTPPAATGMFSDVPVSDFAAPFIEQLAREGISGGCSATQYCPSNPVTRAQMAIFLLRAEHGSTYAPLAATGMFLDVPKTDFAAPFIEQLANEKITGGCGGNNYCPGKAVTRDQMAIFLVRAFNLP